MSSYLASASILCMGCPLIMEPSGRGTPWWGMPGDMSACWCMKPMGPRCVGGAL